MQDAAKQTLCNLVEDQLTCLLQEAKRATRHAKRARLADHHNPESSSESSPSPVVRLLDAQDINLVLQWRGSEPIYPTNAGAPPSGQNSAESSYEAATLTPAGYVDLNAYVRSEMRSQPPSEMALSLHWLAVDGVCPDIPENPLLRGAVVHRVADDNDTDNNDPNNNNTLTENGTNNSTANSGVSVRQLIPRLLSEELQLYFSRVTLAVERGDARQQDAALASVTRDAGTQELVPFFSAFVAKQIYANVGKAGYCRTLIRLADALISNPFMHLELYLHQLIPVIITCVVAHRLSSLPTDEEHWALREDAARTLVKACNLFGSQYTTLKSRMLKTLCEAIGPDKPLTTQYGGIVGISLFGYKAIDAFLLPLAERWEVLLGTEKDERKRLEIRQCQQAMLNAVGIFLHHSSLFEKCEDMDIHAFVDTFGDKLIPLQTGLTEYECLFI